jgi:hypothetical protein
MLYMLVYINIICCRASRCFALGYISTYYENLMPLLEDNVVFLNTMRILSTHSGYILSSTGMWCSLTPWVFPKP